MDNQMVELCAKALWERSQQEPANQYRYKHLARKPGPITWKDINDVDIIPSLANECRENAKVVISAMRNYILNNSKNAQHVLDMFYTSTARNDK